MASMLRTSAEIQHVTAIPPGIPVAKAVKLLHDHAFFLSCDPHMIKFEVLPTPSDPAPTIPEEREVEAIAPAKVYSVTDRVHTLPAGLWDSDVVSTCEYFNLENGLFVRLQSPLSVVMETVWLITEAEDGSCELFEDVVIKCSRFLIGIVKGTCESGWNDVHGKIIEKMKEP
ncbi:hypothetical protein EDB81DRAFT_179331 [Dactylonectria macrodidyma]|uniref:DUF7053 domain-containing protein n=1 Tax=Dactylonectria macrodidyma TaxID=307937 RepID=A0A9P9FR13_9HYPO|nr:hypothetical protein EDB81DRAFT_179331 [Dactylonectria macrodidyma]